VTRVLVVDDEDAIRDAVAYVLRADGQDVEVAATGEDAVDAIGEEPFDLIILDVMLPDVSGIEVARRVRAQSDVPIIMLTARSSEADLIVGFDAGADDYIAKPFSVHELVTRARAILRRREIDAERPQAVQCFGALEIDLLRHVVRVSGRPTRLTPTEFKLLARLAQEDRAFTRRELLEAAWDTLFVPDPRSCDVHVANLRRKVEDDPANPTRIVTVRGVGYRLVR
jgi:two-component system response regulator RegX3